MTAVHGYRIGKKLIQGPAWVLYLGEREADLKPVIIRCPDADYPGAGEAARLRHEYDLAVNLDNRGVLKPLALVENDKKSGPLFWSITRGAG